MMIDRLSVTLGIVLGALAGGICLPAYYGIWRIVFRKSPFANAGITAILAVVASSAVFSLVVLGFLLPVHPWVTNGRQFTLAWMATFSLAMVGARFIIDRGAQRRRPSDRA
ncbi:MAG TPA: hypothetical protein VGP25_14200 [Gemmatimonadaceae bacterium]|jgi:hypothetical protein|nr:hypothetical protein [Gemmatimonadaceae bacterium]